MLLVFHGKYVFSHLKRLMISFTQLHMHNKPMLIQKYIGTCVRVGISVKKLSQQPR